MGRFLPTIGAGAGADKVGNPEWMLTKLVESMGPAETKAQIS